MSHSIKDLLGAAALALTIGACSESTPSTEETPKGETLAETQHVEPHINWFEGSVDEAFVKAEAEGKPVLLYWGAVWCPPCNQLKATIFKRPDFVAKTQEFVAVYLDGDTERAQKYGEEFGNAGYPTLIVLNGRDKEVTRIPGGMNLEAYVTVLDLALARVQPAGQLLEEILDNGREATSDELTLLAHYSWGQDQGKALGERDKPEVFNALSQMTPETLPAEKARFEAEYLDTLSRAEDPLEEDVRLDAIGRAHAFLTDPKAHRAEPFFATTSAKRFIEKVADEDDVVKEALISDVEGALAIMAEDKSYTPAIGLYYYIGLARLEELRTEEISDELKTKVREAVTHQLSEAKTDYERSTVMNTSIGALLATEQDGFATEILKEEIKDGANAYYWMVDIAGFLEDAGQNDEAVVWFKKAYDEAEGFATRAQWGSYYVDGMTRLRSDDPALIEEAAGQVLGELAAQNDPIYARNKGAVKRIGRALNKWAFDEEATTDLTDEVKADRADVHGRLDKVFEAICDGQFPDEDELTVCKALFHPTEV